MPNKAKDIYFFLVVLFSGMALSFFRSHEGLIILWLMGLVIFRRETFYTSPKLLWALAVWMGYFVINTYLIRSFHPFFMLIYVVKIMIAYWLLGYYREGIFKKYEDTIYYLTVITLVFYAVQLVAPGPMYSWFKAVDLSQNLFPNRTYASIGIYTYHKAGLFNIFPRNAGFTWEPGPFSSYVVLAMFINIARNRVQLIDKKRLLVFLIAIISAQSTTSFVILLVIILWYFWARYKNKSFVFIAVPVILLVIIYMFITIPWLQEKIIKESTQDVEDILHHAQIAGTSHAPGRFASWQLRWQDFKNYPIAGFGGSSKLETGYLGENNVVAAINGLGTILGKYGMIGSVLFLLLVFKTGKWLSKHYQFSGGFMFPVLILIVGFGFSIIESPLLVTLWMTPFFLNTAQNSLTKQT